MADRRRIVRRPSSGTVVVQDLDDQATYVQVRNSFKVSAPPRQPIMARRQRRYGGARTVGENHDNGSIAFTSLVRGTSVDDCYAKAEALLSVLESPRTGLFFEWRPEGSTKSSFYEIRGPATWQLKDYDQRQMTAVRSMQLDVTIPVGPLVQLDRVTQTIAAHTYSDKVALPSPIGGTAPALVDVTCEFSNTIGARPDLSFAMLGWAPHAAVGSSGNPAPFGKFNGHDTVNTDEMWSFSTQNVTPDDFSSDIEIEVWAYIYVPTGTGGSRATMSLFGAGASIAAVVNRRFPAEWGSIGAPLGITNNYQLYRLGTLTVPCDPDSDPVWTLLINVPTGSSSTGSKLKWIFLNPARSRAVTKTAAPKADIPLWANAAGDPLGNHSYKKTIRGEDLAGFVEVDGGPRYPDSGMGGSPIEMAPGNNDLMILWSENVPNGVASEQTAASTQTSIDSIVTLSITPRVWLAGGP